jgi:tetratricopeptide (TPR) repeat protein
VRTNRLEESYEALSANADSQYLDANGKGQRYLALTQLAYNLKKYPETVEWANKAINSGHDTAEIRLIIAQTNYLQGKYKEAATAMQEVVSRAEKAGQRPTEASLQLLFQCYVKLNDQPNQGRVIEKLVAYYPKPDYWLNAMITLIQAAQSAHDDRLLLQVYRLQTDVGTMKRNDQYGEMSKLAVEQGYPGEAIAVLSQAMDQKVFTDARENAQYSRLLEAAKKALAQEKEVIAKSEAEALKSGNGDLLVAVGASYLFNMGDATKAVSLIQQGISKGLSKIPAYDAYVTLGLAHAKAKSGGEADRAFGKVDKNDNYERLAKLWSLRVK